MITVRQIERLWDERQYARLTDLLASGRVDLEPSVLSRRSSSEAAALSVIRLDELAQNACPVAARLVRAVLATQQPDGGWGGIATTVLAIRALRCSRGEGLAIARGIDWLASLQKDEGAWPAEPIRRLPADAQVTAFVLANLAADPLFLAAARVEDAVNWLAKHRHELDDPTRRIADRVARQRRSATALRSSAPFVGGLFAEASLS